MVGENELVMNYEATVKAMEAYLNFEIFKYPQELVEVLSFERTTEKSGLYQFRVKFTAKKKVVAKEPESK